MAEFQLGQRVRFAEHIKRTWVESKGSEPNKVWTGQAYPGKRNHGGEGIITGKRTLSDGYYDYGYGEDPGVYRATRHFTAYQVVTSLRSAPVHVLPEHITEVTE